MKIKLFSLIGLLFFLYSCSKDTDVAVPAQGPGSIIDQTHSLQQNSKLIMDGVYKVTSGSDYFGEYIVVKSNPSGLLFTNNNGKHFILDVGYLDSVIFIQGYWRDGYSDATGLCSMYITSTEGGAPVINGKETQEIIIRGAYGNDNNIPDQPFTLEYLRPFSPKVKNSNFYILGHRAGGRNSDRLPVSENSIAMVRFTEKLGTTGIEVDPRISSDGVVFIYHDADINTRLTQKGPLAGDIASYTWYEISTFVRLIHGEKVPSLEELLTYTIDSTDMRFVYLDMKSAEAVPVVIPIQKRALQRAKDKGRDIMIVMGIPNTDVLTALMAYPDYQDVPSLCELTVDDTRMVSAKVWAPRWTLGTQNELVQQMQNEGRIAVCWTIDTPNWVNDFINNGNFDGMLTNFPYVVAYYHYIQE
jgi:glycerophosphoryl diester phosphodiesterase